LKGSHASFAEKYNLKKGVFINQLEKEYDKIKSMSKDTTFKSTCELSTILTTRKIEYDIFKNIFTTQERLIALEKNEMANIKLLLASNAEIDSLIKISS